MGGLLSLRRILAKGMVCFESLSVIVPLTVCCAKSAIGNERNKAFKKNLSIICFIVWQKNAQYY
jgi:hypothetical protein